MKAKYIAGVLGAFMLCTSCVNDLETLPLNATDTTSETAYGADESGYVAGLAKLYLNFISNDTTDLLVSDAGNSELLRGFWSCQEVTTDACKCAWPDAWVATMNTDTYSDAANDAVYTVFVRTLQGISYVNEYLRQTASGKLSDRGVSPEVAARVEQFRAEARFLRAYFYWMAMDVFGAVPFTTEDSPFGAEAPSQAARADVYRYIVGELEALAADGSAMPAARSNYPRADKGAVLGLLSRVYLNAGVYTGTPEWEKCQSVCERLFQLGYDLCPKHADLFRGDNGENPDARKELIFAADYNAESAQSYGGSTYMAFGAIAADEGKFKNSEGKEVEVVDANGYEMTTASLNGTNNGWGGIRVPYEYVSRYFNVQNQNYDEGTYDVVDERGQIFYILGRSESMEGGNLYDFKCGWSCFKYNNAPHDIEPVDYRSTAQIKSFADIDFPLIRLGEIYLTYAEACLNLGQSAKGLPYLKLLADRAGVPSSNSAYPSDGYDNDFLMAERARELMWEGHRRTDLIRFGKYVSGYNWTWKGGDFMGHDIEPHKVLFAIPSSQLTANPKLQQNPGYTKTNE